MIVSIHFTNELRASCVSNRCNTENLVLSNTMIVRICKYLKGQKINSYLSLVYVSTICVDVGIIGKKICHRDLSFGSNCGARVSRLDNMDYGTVLTDKTKTKYLDERRKK
jgi:hypothetical protein